MMEQLQVLNYEDGLQTHWPTVWTMAAIIETRLQ